MAARFGLMQLFRKNHPDALFINLGNLCNEEDTVLTRVKAEALREIYADAGYDAVNVGLSEMVFADIYLAGSTDENAIPFVTSNLDGLAAGVPGYIDVDCGGVIVRVTGVLADKELPDSLEDIGYEKASMKKRVKKLSKASGNYDLLVVLASNCDASYERRIAYDVRKHCDVIIAGGGVGEVPAGFTDIKNIITVYSPNWSRFVGEIVIQLDEKNEVVGWKNTYYPVTGETMPDERTARIIEQYYEDLFTLINSQNLLAEPAAVHPGGEFRGNDACAECHVEQYRQWINTGHAFSYQSLVNDKAERNPECVECHVTGYSFIGGFNPIQPRSGFDYVGCEECHGPGSSHVSAPDENVKSPVNENTCLRCHSGINSPGFDYGSYRDRIIH